MIDPDFEKKLQDEYGLTSADIARIGKENLAEFTQMAIAGITEIQNAAKSDDLKRLIQATEAMVFMGFVVGYAKGKDEEKNKKN